MGYQRLLVLSLVGALCLFGCTGSPPTAASSITIAEPTPAFTVTQTATRCTLTGLSGPIAAGLSTFTAVNATTGLVGFDLWRITEPNTFADLVAYVEKDKDLATNEQPGLGHPSFVSDLVRAEVLPSKTLTANGTVRQGTYGVVCIGQTGAGLRPIAALGPIQVR